MLNSTSVSEDLYSTTNTPLIYLLYSNKEYLSTLNEKFNLIIVNKYSSLDLKDVTVDEEFMKKIYNVSISKEEIEAFLIHRKAWNEFLVSGRSTALFIEDNVYLSEGFEEIFELAEELPSDWDVCFPFEKSANPNPLYDQPYLLKFYWGSCAYILSKSGALKLLSVTTIRQPLDEEIIFQSLQGDLQLYTSKCDTINIDFDNAMVHRGRKREVHRTVNSYFAWSEIHKTLIRQLLSTISAIANSASVKLILHGGTLLGHIQHNEIIPWDDDVDLGIDEIDFPNFENALMQDNRLKIMKRLEQHTGKYYYKIWSETGDIIENYPYKFPFVDIWLYTKQNENIVFHNGIFFPNAIRASFQLIQFEQNQFWIPANAQECLDSMYEAWRVRFHVYPFCHRLERVVNKAFKIPIFSDPTGRFIDYKVF